MSNYTQRQETIDALASMVIEQADRHGFKIEIDAIRDAVEQMAKFAGIEANETEFMLASQKVEDEARLMGKLSEKSGEMENPQERYRLSAMDEGNDHYSVLDTKTQLYWSSEGWQRPDSGWASVLTRSEAARKAYELNRKLTHHIEQSIKQDLKFIVARIEADIALLRMTCDDPISIKLSDKIDIEIRPTQDDDRVLVGRSDWGFTVVNYTTEGLILDVIAEGDTASLHMVNFHGSDLEISSPDDLSSPTE